MFIVALVLFVVWVSPTFGFLGAFPPGRWSRKTSPTDHHEADSRRALMPSASVTSNVETREARKSHPVVVCLVADDSFSFGDTCSYSDSEKEKGEIKRELFRRGSGFFVRQGGGTVLSSAKGAASGQC